MTDHHTHIGQFNQIYYDYHDVFSALKNNGISETTLAYLTPEFKDERNALDFYCAVTEELKEAKTFAEGIGLKTNILYWADPLVLKSMALGEIFTHFGYSGIALHPTIHPWTREFPDALDAVFEFARERKLPVYIHTGISDCDEPVQFEKWIRGFQDVEVHLAHCKDPDAVTGLFSKYRNLFGDTAFCPEDSCKAICNAGFRDRMLFGTDFPITHYWEHCREKNPPADEKSLTESYAKTLGHFWKWFSGMPNS